MRIQHGMMAPPDFARISAACAMADSHRGRRGIDRRAIPRYRHTAMAKLVTTNLRFPEETFRELRYQAARRKVPVALLVREAVDRYLGRSEDDETPIPLGSDPADAFIGSIGSGVDDESVNHDH